MGICKCKRRTDLFCFVHHKAVCENCICTDHHVCVVKTYVEWLTDSEYDPATCGVCKEILKPDNVIRLCCLDVFHPECLDVYASSLPRHTAKAGYLCPTCNKQIFPNDDQTTLSQLVLKHLAAAPWASNILAGKVPDASSPVDAVRADLPPPAHLPGDVPESSSSAVSSSATQPAAASYQPLQPLSSPSPYAGAKEASTPLTKRGQLAASDTQESSSFASRKPAKDHVIVMNDSEDEDKYEKRTIKQLLVNLGLMSTPAKNASRQRSGGRVRLDAKRGLILFALLATLVTVIVLGMSMTSDPSLDDAAENILDA
eukprot:TRINITY_DN4535_c0_g1_i1.p1 TRINITY_DN4535_c0_g1~~TRINITY_DN4535_c0_g1_i1.p1  ORF type:complete len:314 (-),score=61.95 TRINITY_DN4535_c0_g1_i1:149-1090(-)